jgi:hypothetical protein
MENSMRQTAHRWKNLCAVWRLDGKICAPFGGQMEKSMRRLAARWKKLGAVWRIDGKNLGAVWRTDGKI